MNSILDHLVKSEIRAAIVARNRRYDAEVNALPPYRDVDAKAINIVLPRIDSLDSFSNIRYPYAQVAPFTRPDLTGAQRAALYANLECRKPTGADLPPQEKELIGQWGVIAAKDIAKGTCVGIFTGVLVPKEIGDKYLLDHDYLISLTMDERREEIYLDGDGIMSKINTLIEYGENGRPGRQAPSLKINARWRWLRCSYHYRDDEVRRLNRPPG
ncbi:hypothetical protein [Acerihabitans arboris]|uniref:Uncharacterized protein n=1 Tax=Acerihabitans arboris TaxID=2691583 RepID=A0A845SKR9_9GAMM|nr:hypothetical protein [Acerihabitans arboris]NDL64579.1 hypothetical protein [Acerihabitans arboris]